MANDRRQIEIEKGLRRYDIYYLRKRQTKGEARRLMGSRRYMPITKEELAQAVAGCDLDPVVPRSGKDNLFTETYYRQVFPNSDPLYYVTRLMLLREVTACGRGKPQWGYTKWLVLGFVWKALSPHLRTKANQEQFRLGLWKGHSDLVEPLQKLIKSAYAGAMGYYNVNKGSGTDTVDISLFFRSKRGRHLEFNRHWRRLPRGRRQRFMGHLRDVIGSIEANRF